MCHYFIKENAKATIIYITRLEKPKRSENVNALELSDY